MTNWLSVESAKIADEVKLSESAKIADESGTLQKNSSCPWEYAAWVKAKTLLQCIYASSLCWFGCFANGLSYCYCQEFFWIDIFLGPWKHCKYCGIFWLKLAQTVIMMINRIMTDLTSRHIEHSNYWRPVSAIFFSPWWCFHFSLRLVCCLVLLIVVQAIPTVVWRPTSWRRKARTGKRLSLSQVVSMMMLRLKRLSLWCSSSWTPWTLRLRTGFVDFLTSLCLTLHRLLNFEGGEETCNLNA